MVLQLGRLGHSELRAGKQAHCWPDLLTWGLCPKGTWAPITPYLQGRHQLLAGSPQGLVGLALAPD